MALLLRSLVGVAVIGCGGAPEPGTARAVASVSASASAAAPALPSRSYSRGPRAYAVVDEAGPFSSKASVSPDGLLVALHPEYSPSIVFYDVDRRRIVGRAESAPTMLTSDAPIWLDDARLLVAGYGSEVLYDARRGALIPPDAHAAIQPGYAAKRDDAAGARVTVREGGLFERGKSGPEAVPLLRFEPGRAPRLIEPTGGASFAARCENRMTSTLGAVAALPESFAQEPSRLDGTPQLLLSKDGAYRVAFTPMTVTLREVASGKARELDTGTPCTQVELHPNEKSLITAAHVQGIGMGWHPDPDASVRVFDLASGALTKKLAGESFRFSSDKSKLLVLGSDEAVVYDAATYKRLRSWRGVDNEVSLDPTARFALVKIHERPAGGLGPHETKELFVEDIPFKHRVIKLNAPEGYFAFDDAGSRFAFAPFRDPYDQDVRAITLYDLASGKVASTVRLDEPISRLAFLGAGKVLAIWTRRGVVLHRLTDGRRVTLYAVPEGEKCRLFAVDEEAHFQGEPGARLAFRYGDDLRTSEVVAASAEAARADDRLLEKFFAGP